MIKTGRLERLNSEFAPAAARASDYGVGISFCIANKLPHRHAPGARTWLGQEIQSAARGKGLAAFADSNNQEGERQMH